MNQEAVLGYEEVSFKLSQVQEDYKSLQRQFKVHINKISYGRICDKRKKHKSAVFLM